MDLFEAIEKRASVRAFAPCDISEDELLRIVEAGRRAPSGRNRQPWEFILITDTDVIAKLGEIQGCIGEATAAIALVMNDQASDYWKEDAAAAIENMLLAVTALGYASLWVEGYVLHHEDMGKEILGVPDNLRLLAVLPIGKPSGEAAQAEKKPLNEILHRDRYGNR